MIIGGLQLLLTFFTFFMIYVLFFHWKRKEITLVTFSVWGGIWLIFILMVIFPDFFRTSIISNYFVRLMDFGMVAALVVLTYLTVENNIKIKKLEKEIETLVRELAVRSIKRKG